MCTVDLTHRCKLLSCCLLYLMCVIVMPVIAPFAITINSNVCPHIRVMNTLMRNPMRDVIGIRYFRSTLGSCIAQITVIFRVKVSVRIRFRVRVLGNSDYCVLKFICVPRYKKKFL